MHINSLYNNAQRHVLEHTCSAHPYKSGERLAEIVKQYQPSRILEIGTGAGFTTMLMALCSQAVITTIEKDSDHASLAQQYFRDKGVESRITLLEGIAEELLATITPSFDLIFFDGFQIHYEFLPHYYRLLKPGGVLVLANNHLTSKTSDRFFAELGDVHAWHILDKFDDTMVVKRL